MTADPRPARRIRDSGLMRLMHSERTKECAITGATQGLEIHHILPRGQSGDDVRPNLVFLRRDIHRRITANDPVAMRLLGEYILRERQDFMSYLTFKLRPVQAEEWMRRRLLIGDTE
jgi:5-methylcytosine-specific restriction endonuclease McrA